MHRPPRWYGEDKRWQKQAGQDRDDRNHNQQLNQRKRFLFFILHQLHKHNLLTSLPLLAVFHTASWTGDKKGNSKELSLGVLIDNRAR
jgi:hypothetical protein